MSANINIDSPLNFTSGEISFQQLKNTFGGGDAEGKNIKFSDYARDTSDSKLAEDIIVPDSTENSDIAGRDFSDINDTVENLSIETFRDSNKYYNVLFTGIDAQKEFESYFNNNLTKNIPKDFDIGSEDGNTTGTLVSGDSSVFAAKLTADGNIRNMNMTVNPNSAIYGAGGSQGASAAVPGGDGGGALHLNVGNANRYFVFKISENAKVWAGGAGGEAGSSSSPASTSCHARDVRHVPRNTKEVTRDTTAAYSETGTLTMGDGRGCSRKFRRTPAPAPGPGYTVPGHGAERGTIRGWRGTRKESSTCTNYFTKSFPERRVEVVRFRVKPAVAVKYKGPETKGSVAAAGAPGGYGGSGEGWFGGVTGSIQSAQPGGPGSPGNSNDCNTKTYTFPYPSLNSELQSKAGSTKQFDSNPVSTSPGTDGKSGYTWGVSSLTTNGPQGGTAIMHSGGINFIGTDDTGNSPSNKLKGKFSG